MTTVFRGTHSNGCQSGVRSRPLSVSRSRYRVFSLDFSGFRAPVRLDVGPGDGGYVQGLDERGRYDGEATFRVMTRRSRLRLPLTVEGPATLTLRVAPLVPIVLRIAFDDGTVREASVPVSAEFPDLNVEIPAHRVRADVRLRTEVEDGGAGAPRIDDVQWRDARVDFFSSRGSACCSCFFARRVPRRVWDPVRARRGRSLRHS